MCSWPKKKTTFFSSYQGEADIVRCFCCDLGLAEWDAQDDPWVEHARHNSRCLFLKREKGEDYVNDVQLRWKKVRQINIVLYVNAYIYSSFRYASSNE